VPESGGPKGSARSYATTWLPTEPGKYRAEPADALLASANLSSEIEVTTPTMSCGHPETDHALLARLAKQTEGPRPLPGQLSELPSLLPNHALAISGTPDVQPLWDRPLTLALFVLLLTLEWVGRRLIRLS
jgi:hypothetical protein